MKKHISVFGLFAKSSFAKILFIMAAMTASQFLLFKSQLNQFTVYYNVKESFPSIDTLISKSRCDWIFGIAFIFISVILCLSGTSFSSKTEYTLDRLSVSPRNVFFCQAIYNLSVYIILWALQTAICFWLSAYYVANAPAEAVSNQSIFLAFYRSNFLHALLPLSEITLWIRNALLTLSLSVATAEYPYKQRHKKLGISAMAMISFTIFSFKASIAESFNLILNIFVFAIIIVEMLYIFFSEENSYEN